MAFLNTIVAFLGEAAAGMTPFVTAPNKMWHILILKTFAFIGDYGWRIVVFTILLKLVLSPLDFYQRYKMHKNQKITERLKPTMEKIQKQYGNDKQAFSQKQMELNRKEGYSYFSACLPMIATLVVFITLWLSMNTVAQYMTFKEYTTMYDEYNIVYEQVVGDKGETVATSVAQDAVFNLYYNGIDDEYVQKLRTKYGLADTFELEERDKIQASFLWIKNIWAPDIPWGNRAILDWNTFNTAINKYAKPGSNGLTSEQIGACLNESTYNRVMYKLLNDDTHSKVNGFLILQILVVLLSVGSQLLSTFQQKKAGQVNAKGGMATSMKVMMFIMPVMMAVFAIQYASIFTLYMVTNSAMTLFMNFTMTGVVKLIDKTRSSRRHGIKVGSTRGIAGSDSSAIIHYVKGANPNAGKRETQNAAPAAKKVKDKDRGARTAVKSSRPDPNELMNTDVGDGKRK